MRTDRTIVIGDVHGCIDELKDLLEAVEFQLFDRLILLGDLIDRGPDPAAVVDLALSLNAECVMGNHEEKALRWRRHEAKRKADPTHYKNPMSKIAQNRLDQWNSIPDKHWDWIAGWPKFIHINDKWTGVHAGCMPDVEIEKQVDNELMRLRYVRCISSPQGYLTYKMASLKDSGEAPDPKSGETVEHWTRLWTGPRNIVYGHYVWDHVNMYSKNEALTLGIDTGCVHGGTLTALIFDLNGGVKVAGVKARKTYSERKPWNEE